MAVGGVSAPAHRIGECGHSFNPTAFQLQEEILAMEGEYSVNYETLSSIGKGAFGFVRLAQRRQDGMVVSESKSRYQCVVGKDKDRRRRDSWLASIKYSLSPTHVFRPSIL